MSDWTATKGRSPEHQRYVEEAERKMAGQRRAEEREQRRRERQSAVDRLRAEMREEIATLRAAVDEQREFLIEVVGTSLGEYGNKIFDRIEKMVDDALSELRITSERSYGELMGRLDAASPDTRSRSRRTKDFKFSNERDDSAVDQPNPLVRKTVVN